MAHPTKTSRRSSTPAKPHLKLLSWLLLVAWCALIFYFSSENGEESAELSGGLLSFLNLGIDEFLLRKAAHFTEYLILGALAFNVARYQLTRSGATTPPTVRHRALTIIFSIFFGALYAISDEFHQTFVGGRSPQLFDVLIDTAGVATGVLLLALLLHLIRSKKHPNLPNSSHSC